MGRWSSLVSETKKLEVKINFIPRKEQQQLINYLKKVRFVIGLFHRRYGKTSLGLYLLYKECLECKDRAPLFAYIGAEKDAAMAIVWDEFKNLIQGAPDGLVEERKSDKKFVIHFPDGRKGTIYVLGSKNAKSLRGRKYHGIVLDETQEQKISVFDSIIRPLVSDTMGFMFIIGTHRKYSCLDVLIERAKSLPHYKVMCKNVYETGVIHPDEIAALKAELPYAEWCREFLCTDPGYVDGGYYTDPIKKAYEMGRICEIPYDPNCSNTIIGWDLGFADPTAIAIAQVYPTRVNFIDCEERKGLYLRDWVGVANGRRYSQTVCFLPHDAKQGKLELGRTREEFLRESGLGGYIQSLDKPTDLLSDIQYTKGFLARCYFDSKKTQRIVECLGNYKTKYNPAQGCFEDKPDHDWSSHMADAVRAVATGLRDHEYLLRGNMDGEDSVKNMSLLADYCDDPLED